MPGSNFSEESFFFLHVKSVCRSPAITCSPDIGVIEAARLMRDQNIAGLIVVDNKAPVGILSVRDLRDIVASDGGEDRCAEQREGQERSAGHPGSPGSLT